MAFFCYVHERGREQLRRDILSEIQGQGGFEDMHALSLLQKISPEEPMLLENRACGGFSGKGHICIRPRRLKGSFSAEGMVHLELICNNR